MVYDNNRQTHGNLNMAARRAHGVQRVLTKLESSVKAGDYYEAHQMYRTLYFRYLAQKKYEELLQLIHEGATWLLTNDQLTSGADLSILFVDVLQKSENAPSDDYFKKLSRLFEMIGPEIPERETFLSNALQWSTKGLKEHRNGHPNLHQYIAQVYWKEKNYTLARHHFLHSEDGTGCATMLVELHRQRGFACEVDLFIAQAVLQYLCLQNKQSAVEAFKCYTKQHPNIQAGPPYILPLLNFIWFLLQTVESGKLAAFIVLCEKYEPSIKRDPSYTEYLDKISQIFFGVAAARPKTQGFLGNFLSSIFSELGNSDSSDEDTPNEPCPSTSRLHMETDNAN
ncbi:Golgi to ER traffic protein 4 homolog [Schistocerca serialis cubense]|uniref:Golgi to ER traffic protein 4 homolog n=2 Tax=Schistocerca TaxID=7008 RepID=UPI00214E370A|nr:Golgi to ER traffic protein 4 homolog [Schistocerca serialis cubense]